MPVHDSLPSTTDEAPIAFDDRGHPVSPIYGDVYRSRAGAFREADAVFVGGCVRRWAESAPKEKLDVENGVLCASGFVAGEGLAGVGIAAWTYVQGKRAAAGPFTDLHGWLALGVFAVAVVVLRRSTRKAA